MCEWGFEVPVEGAIKQKVNFIFNHVIVADFTQAFLNRFGGVAVTTTFNVKLVV